MTRLMTKRRMTSSSVTEAPRSTGMIPPATFSPQSFSLCEFWA